MARVLVAEDDPATRRLIAGILADFGHQVRECAAAEETQAWLKAGPIDVLVSDLVLRGDRLERDCSARGVAAVSLSGWPYGSGDKPRPLRDKPFRVSDLEAVVEAVAAARSNSPHR